MELKVRGRLMVCKRLPVCNGASRGASRALPGSYGLLCAFLREARHGAKCLVNTVSWGKEVCKV